LAFISSLVTDKQQQSQYDLTLNKQIVWSSDSVK